MISSNQTPEGRSHTQNTHHVSELEQKIWDWLDQVVIGLNLCPFAKKPRANDRIRLVITDANKQKSVLSQLEKELQLIATEPAVNLETTLLALPNCAHSFYDFLELVDKAQACIEKQQLSGIIQIAHFHPQYQFSDTHEDDQENYTNRAPCPILHLIREDLMEQVLSKYPNPESIPDNNIATMNQLTKTELQALFPFVEN